MPFFSKSRVYAVLGASSNPAKFGHKVTAWYLERDLPVYAINPGSSPILGLVPVKNIAAAYDLTQSEHPDADGLSLSVITPPQVTKEAIKNAKGVKSVWFQPGSWDEDCVEVAKAAGIEVVTGCILVSGDSNLQAVL